MPRSHAPYPPELRRRMVDALRENFFATLKCELLDCHRFQTQAEARDAGVHVILSLRDDFLIRCHEQPALARVFELSNTSGRR